MKPLKGLYLDTRPQEQPDGTYPFAKNGVQNDLDGSVFNEPGIRNIITAVVPYQLMGIIETDGKPVVFSTDNTNSAIGYFNPETELYEPIIDDNPANLFNYPADGTRLEFNVKFYITGQSQRNYKGEMVVAFTDKEKYPKYVNCDNPSIASIDDLRLFPFFHPPSITAVPVTGGRLSAGTYYIAVGYERNDGTSTSYSSLSKFVTIPPTDGVQGLTDKAIEITIQDADTTFDSMRIGIVSKVDGKTTAVEVSDFIPITGTSITYTFTGDNLTTDISISDILVQPVFYDKVDTIGQLNDALYLGGLQSEADLNDMQPFACTVRLEWVSELYDAVNPPEEHVNGTKKGWMHEEVGAFYIRYRKVRGGTTKWFTIPGNTAASGDLSASSEAASGGYIGSVPKYKVEDTIPYFSVVDNSGGTGIWVNDTEIYPDTIDFDASTVGGTNLRNQPVRHHKLPSLRWCKKNLYLSINDYGRTKLDILGIRAVNVRIPAKYNGIIDGYELGYAKRTVGNMTVYGQSVLMHGTQSAGNVIPIYTTGGNFDALVYGGDTLTLRKNTFRFHAFDLLYNKPSITPTFISAQLRLRKDGLQYLEDGSASEAENADKLQPVLFLADYTQGNIPTQVIPGNFLRAISSSFYLTVDVNVNDFTNIRHENTFAGRLLGPDWALNRGISGFKKEDRYQPEYIANPGYEETYLVNLIAVKTDLYSSLFSQSLVSAGNIKALTDTTPFFGGDAFISDYTFHTYGRHNALDEYGDGTTGIKVIRRFVCESVSNINLRYEIPGNQYSKWYPHNGVVPNSPSQTYITLFDRSKDPNQFGYSKDFNALNDLVNSIIYNPFREELTYFPFRIHRGGKNNRGTRARSWRTFLPLDYYEMQKNMGRIIHLEGMDDHLLIHMENALFLTQNKATLDTAELNVTLGSGDIFQFEPQPVQNSKLGVGGTQHDLACVNTPIGYVFPDAKQGEIYIFKDKLVNLGIGITTFIREYMRITDRNNYTGNGITIGWDQKYKRILLTVKNKSIPDTVIKQFADTNAFWDSLETGDIINYFGRLIQYQGVNNAEETGYTCPDIVVPDVITWQKTNPSCQQVDSTNTGYRTWATRIRLVNGVADGYSEDNTPEGTGTYFPPVYDTTSCPLPSATVTWKGNESVCGTTTSTCPAGYTLSDDSTTCTKEETTDPDVTQTSICVVASQLATTYSQIGTKLYSSGYGLHLTGASTLLTTPYWKEAIGSTTGPMNRVGVWVDINCDGTKDALTTGTTLEFTKQITSTLGETIYIGVGGDNTFQVDVNGITIVQCDTVYTAGLGPANDNFRYWHLFPVVIPAGASLISFKATGDGSVNDSFGTIIYRNNAAALTAATADGDLTISFKSTDIIGTPIDIATCPAGWILDTTGGSGSYVCRKTTTADPIEGNTGLVVYTQRCRYINGIADGYCEENDSASPDYVSPIIDTTICPVPPEGLGCGATIDESYNGSDLHTYARQLISIATGVVNINWESFDRPNQFTLYKDSIAFLTTGWKGYAGYSGPWGATLSSATFGTMSYTPATGSVYEIEVKSGPADPDNLISDTYRFTISCGV